MSGPRGGYDELRFPDDLTCTITKAAWERGQTPPGEVTQP